MNDSTTYHSYSKLNRIFEGVSLIIGLPLLMLMIYECVTIYIHTKTISGLALLLPGAALFIFYGSHTQYPDIITDDAGVKVRIFWRWWNLTWHDVRAKKANMYFIVVSSSELPALYLLFGVAMKYGQRCFMVNRQISQYELLVEHLRL